MGGGGWGGLGSPPLLEGLGSMLKGGGGGYMGSVGMEPTSLHSLLLCGGGSPGELGLCCVAHLFQCSVSAQRVVCMVRSSLLCVLMQCNVSVSVAALHARFAARLCGALRCLCVCVCVYVCVCVCVCVCDRSSSHAVSAVCVRGLSLSKSCLPGARPC